MKNNFIDQMFPDMTRLRKKGKCPTCGKKIEATVEFVDEVSKREYEITGLCQACQDRIFKLISDE